MHNSVKFTNFVLLIKKDKTNMETTINNVDLSGVKKCILVTLQRIIPQITEVSIDIKTDYNKRIYVKIKTTSFQTIPVIFKEIWVEGSCYPSWNEENGCFMLNFNFQYKWSYYDGGTNGTDFGNMRLNLYTKKDNNVLFFQPFTYSNINIID